MNENGTWTDRLSFRAMNILHNAGALGDKEKAIELVRSGQIRRYRLCGKVTVSEIAKALDLEGYELPIHPGQKIKLCPHCHRKISVRIVLDPK